MNPSLNPVPIVAAEAVCKSYRRGAETVRAISDLSLAVQPGEFVAIVGPSGAGKTTLLHLLGCMDTPTSGRLLFEGRVVDGLGDAALTGIRRARVGFVFQHFGLVPTLTVAENVALPLLFAGARGSERVDALLEQMGLSHRRRHRPHELSGGEMQRVALARALVNRPALLLADEPTGNLDSGTGEGVVALLRECHAAGQTVVVVTHNERLAAAAERRVRLSDGRLVPG